MLTLFVYIIILFLAVIPATAQPQEEKVRTVELTLHPAKTPESVQKYRLLAKAEQQSEADAAPLYEKAVQSLPKNLQTDQINKWVRTPLEELPREQVQSTLKQLKPILELLEQAAKCKYCKWPESEVGEDQLLGNLSKYRQIIYILALQTRLQIAQGQYDKAIASLQTGFAMAERLAEAPALVQGLIGIATAAFMCRQLEQFVQGTDAPNLYWALQNLPRPLVDLTEKIVLESPDIRTRVRQMMNRLDRHVGALQCVEAIRLYPAAHDGKFPNELSDITEVVLPHDPFTQSLFIYHRTGSRAVLEAPVSKEATARDAIRYELILKE